MSYKHSQPFIRLFTDCDVEAVSLHFRASYIKLTVPSHCSHRPSCAALYIKFTVLDTAVLVQQQNSVTCKADGFFFWWGGGGREETLMKTICTVLKQWDEFTCWHMNICESCHYSCIISRFWKLNERGVDMRSIKHFTGC